MYGGQAMLRKWCIALIIGALAIALAACGQGSIKVNAAIEQVSPTGNEREIVIIGSNFAFDQEQYHVAVGETVKIIYQDAEGAHGMNIEGTNIRLRHNDEVVVKFIEPGSFDINCRIYCGAGHALMTAQFVVE